ncbi:hypothetical protein U1Q18_035092, partial [Sarracenia purpurea var. burkii]
RVVTPSIVEISSICRNLFSIWVWVMCLFRRSQEFTLDSEILFFPNTNKLEHKAKSSIVGGGGVLARERERKLRKVRQRRVAHQRCESAVTMGGVVGALIFSIGH